MNKFNVNKIHKENVLRWVKNKENVNVIELKKWNCRVEMNMKSHRVDHVVHEFVYCGAFEPGLPAVPHDFSVITWRKKQSFYKNSNTPLNRVCWSACWPLTCEYDHPVGHFCVADLASSEQHVVEVERVTLTVPDHRSQKLIQTVVGLLALNQRWERRRTRNHSFISTVHSQDSYM